MTNSLLFLLIIIFLISTVLFKLVLSLVFEKGKYDKRLKKYIDIKVKDKTTKTNDRSQKQHNSSLLKVSKGIEKFINLSKNEMLLTQSGVKLSLGELFIGRVMLTIIGMAIGYLNSYHFIIILIIGVIGFYLPMIYVKKKRKKRLLLASKQLGDALGTMANALRAGFSFMQALNMVAKEISEPLGPEFIKALQEINFGIPVEKSFQNLLDRLPDKELEIVLNTLIIQRSTGGNLAQLLETMQETIFDRARLKDEVKTLTAQGKLSGIIITILPIALGFYIKLVNPEYFQLLFSHPLGWAMVIIGCISIVLGWFFINKIVQIEV
ncbi:type II secretion system F family protein [Paenisporosarcina sp. TG20]|uniref:type II secretion system F family protein n=1 Tax=Paenisporosarcina sp. TG20 TaxID=1211706 RepID=UPI0002E75B91|nr:type II secretion system F family protein [Paenisporosarcina sp. TG20]